MFMPAPVHLLPGVSFRLPEVGCSMPARIHPEYPAIYEENAAWVAKFLPVPDQAAMNGLLEIRYPMWDAMIYPKGAAERVSDSSKVTSLLFNVDDIGFLQDAVFAEVAADYTGTRHPYGPAFADRIETYERTMSPQVYRRYKAAVRAWFPSVLEEIRYRKNRQIPDLDTYLELRRINGAVLPYVIAIEHVLDHDLTDVIADDPDFARAAHAVIEHVMLVNDLLSLRHEVFRGEYFNTVCVLLHRNGSHLQRAVDTVSDMIADADETLTRLTKTLRHRYPQPEIHTYLEALQAFCAGNLCWHFSTTRYIGRGNTWNGRRTGTVTLQRDRTTIT